MTQYYSKTKKELVNINDMHHQHVWYAFKKLCDRLEQLALTQAIWDDAFNPAEDIKVNENAYVRKDVYELLFDKCERQDRTIEHYLNENSKLKKNANSRMVLKLERQLSRLREQINRVQKHIGHRYTFSNIPNDDNGRSLVKAMRFYLNKDTYNMRVRGQYLDKSKLEKGESWKTYDDGQPLSKSKCIRLYIDKKKESA
tara:strand:+ start:762 stop:1358 length:597 start_codon:yes stop_codon:yes gene_type:complete